MSGVVETGDRRVSATVARPVEDSVRVIPVVLLRCDRLRVDCRFGRAFSVGEVLMAAQALIIQVVARGLAGCRDSFDRLHVVAESCDRDRYCLILKSCVSKFSLEAL